jgi:DNA recombination protein RmuC
MLAMVLAVVAALLCVAVFVVWRGKAALEDALRQQLALRATAEATLAQIEQDYQQVKADALTAQRALAEARIDSAESKVRLSSVDNDHVKLRDAVSVMEKEIRDYTAKLATMNAEKASIALQLKDQQTYVKEAQEQFKQQFENLANRIFEEKNTQSKQHIKDLLSPLEKDLAGFKTHITESFGKQANEQFALKNEIQNIVKVSNEMKFETANLSKALRGDTKVQGNWGEVILERILEASGLRKGDNYHYVTQGTGLGLKHPEDGRAQKPDVVIMLPEDKHAIIDAKVSLTAYERLCSQEDEAEKSEHLSQFLGSVKNHVRGLEERRYQDTQGLDAPDYVLMFMPIEGAYALAMQHDPDLHAYAWDRKVIIVCPSTLFAILKIIASMWKLDRQNKNSEEIAKRGGALYDKIEGFVSDMVGLGKKLDAAQEEYSSAFDKLSKGRGNVLRQAEMLRELGVKNSKLIPEKLLGGEESLLEAPKEEVA